MAKKTTSRLKSRVYLVCDAQDNCFRYTEKELQENLHEGFFDGDETVYDVTDVPFKRITGGKQALSE